MKMSGLCLCCGKAAIPAFSCTTCGAIMCSKCYKEGNGLCGRCIIRTLDKEGNKELADVFGEDSTNDTESKDS